MDEAGRKLIEKSYTHERILNSFIPSLLWKDFIELVPRRDSNIAVYGSETSAIILNYLQDKVDYLEYKRRKCWHFMSFI